MKRYFITNYQSAYYSEDRDSFGGISFATLYEDKEQALEVLTLLLIDERHPLFLTECYINNNKTRGVSS